MDFKILIFADDPDLAAELLLRLEEAGPFNVIPINSERADDTLEIPPGDAAVIVPSGLAGRTEEMLARLEIANVPVLLLGSAPEADAGPIIRLDDKRDFPSLIHHLSVLCGPRADQVPGAHRGGTVPGIEDARTDKA